MAITINTQILGQEATNVATYCYLYEPLKISIIEDDLTASKLYVDLEIYNTDDDSSPAVYINRYGDYDINTGKSISIDLMKLARQYHDDDIFKFSNIDDISNGILGWQSIVSKFKYKFRIYTDVTLTPKEIYKLPILGGRLFKDFKPLVDLNQKLTEADENNVSLNRFGGLPYLETSLVDPTLQDARPNVSKIISTLGKKPCGGYLIWKSRLGGWMSWGFNIKKESTNKKYESTLDVGMFESTSLINGSPYIPVNYTGINISYNISLKELGLNSVELLAVDGINQSPAAYYVDMNSGTLELMRITSSSVPITNQARGGDFSVSLSSISRSNYKTK